MWNILHNNLARTHYNLLGKKFIGQLLCKIPGFSLNINKSQDTFQISDFPGHFSDFMRPHLDYGDIVFNQSTNDSFCKKLESVQYNAALAITGAIKGTSQVKLYKELGLESLKLRRKLRRLCTFYKIKTTGVPSYLFSLVPNTVLHFYQTRTKDNVTKYQCRAEAFKSSFFPWTITEWNSLDLQIRNLS